MGEHPPRPRWRPGVHVVRRDADHLQAGIDPPHRVILPDRPGVRAALRELPALSAAEPEARVALHALRTAGLLLEGGEPGSASAVSPEARRAAESQFGEDAGRRLAARSRTRVGVRAEHGLHATALGMVRAAGLSLAESGAPPDLWLVVTAGEPDRAEVDPLLREGAAHLLVSAGPSARVGPFVVPGRTACLRCVDAHLAETDPRRPLVVEQVVRAARATGGPPVDPTLAVLALAWAVRDLCRYAEEDRPETWSAVVEVGPAGPPVRRDWARHPHCGCAWDVLA